MPLAVHHCNSVCLVRLKRGATITTHTTSADTGQRKLPLSTKLAFGIGASGEAIYLGLSNAFIVIFYNQVIGLNNALIGIAIMLAMIGDAISDPLVGIVSDRWRSRLGRRHPFLIAAPVPLALSLYCVFNPPDWLLDLSSDAAIFIWLSVWTIVSRTVLTLFNVPHLALGGELSKDQHERSQLFSANTIFGAVSGAGFAFVAWSFFFADEVTRASDGALVPGHLAAESYGPLILTACALIIITIWTCAAGTAKQIPYLSKAELQSNRLNLIEFLRQIASTFKNRNYVVILVGFFFFMIASGIYDTLNIHINTYFWELLPNQIRWFGLVGAVSAITGALLSPIMMRLLDRKPVMLVSLTLTTICAQLVVTLRLFGFMPENGEPMLLPLLLLNAGGFMFSIGMGSVAIMSMIGDIVDQNELLHGVRQEGLFYSARAFFAKASNSIGHFFAGIMLEYYVRLPQQAIPGELDPDTITRLGITAGPVMGAAAIFSLLIYSRYNLSRDDHQNIMRELNARATKPQAE